MKYPGLARVNELLFFTIITGIILYFGRTFFVLITFSGFLAMLMVPVSRRLEKLGASRIFSSLISVLIIVAVLFAAVMPLSAQLNSLTQEFPSMKSRIDEIIISIQAWTQRNLGLNPGQLVDNTSDTASTVGSFVTGVVKGTFSISSGVIIVLVLTFLFLLNRSKYENFAVMLFKVERRKEAKEMIETISKISQQYLTGRLIVIVITGILFVIGFSVLGMKNAVLLSAIAAIASIIPYLGTLLGGVFPLLMAILEGEASHVLWVVIIVLLVNFIVNNFIEPYVGGGSVKISPLFTFITMIMGSMIWGLAGVILFLPLLGIIKIIFENIEGLSPYAYLIGTR